MPNWVRNHIEFGTDKVLKECITKTERDMDEFDFNKVIPMPKELEEENGLEKLTIEERLLFLKEHNGCDNWYDWCIQNWGTKWNSNETFIINDKVVEFDTAWSMPEPVLREISRKYNTTVRVEFADEGIIENSGTVIYEDGMEVFYEPGDDRFRKKVWGWDV